MNSYEMTKEEKEYLSSYNICNYERPSIAADVAIFSILNEGFQDNIRKLQKKSLKLLLIKRATYPYKDYWALPGGFLRPGEDACEAAKRELYDETNVNHAFLELVGVYGEMNRDPRGWIISNTYMALIDGDTCELRAGSDAWEVCWFSVNVEQNEIKREVVKEKITIETEYAVSLVNEEGITLQAKLKEYKSYENYHESVRYEIMERDGLAFDHAKIILEALIKLRKDVEHDSKKVFDLMPEQFTLTQLQNAFEVILEQKLITANFRRKIASFVLETEQMMEGAGFRPAKLFKRNVEAFY